MLVLPNTPPLPVAVTLLTDSAFSRQVSVKRLSLAENPQTPSEWVKYVVSVEEYVEDVFRILVDQSGDKDLAVLAELAAKTVLFRGQPPWRNVVTTPRKKTITLARPKPEWTLAMELGISLISAALMYTKLAANLNNELIEAASLDAGSKWRLVAEYYKKALAMLGFTARFLAASHELLQLHPILVPVLQKVCNIGIQLSTLCRSLWMDRTSLEMEGSCSSRNNGVLCRVAIWIMNEMSVCQNLFKELDSPSGDDAISLNCTGWVQYSEVFTRYVTAYSGLFLSIEYYQKGELGLAIGLVHFALLSLQVKLLSAASEEQKNYKKLKHRLTGKRNNNFISSLHSLTTLNIDRSVFQDSSGVVLNDLTYLFDHLVYLRLKYTKENDNLRFEPVLDWKGVKHDTRWPTGTKIPVSGIEEYSPKALTAEPTKISSYSGDHYF